MGKCSRNFSALLLVLAGPALAQTALVNTDPGKPAHVVTNLTGTAKGRILTGPAMDTHNMFAAAHAIHPAAFSSTNDGGKLAVDLPAKSAAVLAAE